MLEFKTKDNSFYINEDNNLDFEVMKENILEEFESFKYFITFTGKNWDCFKKAKKEVFNILTNKKYRTSGFEEYKKYNYERYIIWTWNLKKYKAFKFNNRKVKKDIEYTKFKKLNRFINILREEGKRLL